MGYRLPEWMALSKVVNDARSVGRIRAKTGLLREGAQQD